MRQSRIFFTSLLCAVLAFLNLATAAQETEEEGEISAFAASDEAYLQQQYDLLQEIVENATAARFNGNKAHDLGLLQKLVDKKVIKSDQRRELQAMGVVMGRLLADEYGLRWVIYTDSLGRSRALQIDATKRVLFPMTMLSRRLEVEAPTNVQSVYEKASAIIEYTRANHVLY